MDQSEKVLKSAQTEMDTLVELKTDFTKSTEETGLAKGIRSAGIILLCARNVKGGIKGLQ